MNEKSLTACGLQTTFLDEMGNTTNKTTLLDLLVKLQREDQTRSERALIAHALRLVRSGRVTLSGIFAGVRPFK
jgi:hypothetical protein